MLSLSNICPKTQTLNHRSICKHFDCLVWTRVQLHPPGPQICFHTVLFASEQRFALTIWTVNENWAALVLMENAVISLKMLHDDAWKTFLLLHSNKQLFNERAWMHFTHKSQDTRVMWFIHSSGRGWSSEGAEEEEHGVGLFKCSKCWETKSPSPFWGWLSSQFLSQSLFEVH